MTAAYLSVLPFVVLNLGGEMIFILDQRLRAQEIGNDRSQKVLQDVVKTMLSKKFVEELFRPQEMYSMTSTRQIFEKLAHSSIMKLNATSMGKLFDLMLMGVKYQFLSCTSPDEFYNVTLTHLQAMADLIKGSSVEVLVNDTMNQFKTRCQTFTAYDMMMIKQQIYRFFQDKHIKVSLFIQDGIQGLDGTIYLNFAGEGVIFGDKPGTCKFYDQQKEIVRTKQINLIHAQYWNPNPYTKRMNNTTQPHLGTNMYGADRIKPPIPQKLEEIEDKTLEEARLKRAQIEEKKSSGQRQQEGSSEQVTREFNQLADLILPSGDSNDDDDFKVNLFPDQNLNFQDQEGGMPISQATDNIINIDLGKQAKNIQLKKLADDLGDLDLSQANQKNTGDELLDLMDDF
eukprot:403359928